VLQKRAGGPDPITGANFARALKFLNGIQTSNLQHTLALAVFFPIPEHVVFSRELFFHPSKNYQFVYTRLLEFENLKATILQSIITLCEMGQQKPAELKTCIMPSVMVAILESINERTV